MAKTKEHLTGTPLVSLVYPPLSRDHQKRRRAFLWSGILKIFCGVLNIAVAILAIIRGFDSQQYATPDGDVAAFDTCMKVHTGEWYCSIILTFINSTTIIISGGFDLSVYSFLKRHKYDVQHEVYDDREFLLLNSPPKKDRTYLCSGFKELHKNAIICSRAALFICTISVTSMQIPTYTGVSCYEISQGYFVRHLNDVDLQIQDYQSQFDTIYAVGILAAFCYHITAHLWNSGWFIAYDVVNTLRLFFGCITVSLSVRFLYGALLFTRGDFIIFNSLPPVHQDLALMMFRWFMASGFLAGALGMVISIVGLYTAWRRSKMWVLTDAFVSVLVLFVMVALFISLFLVLAIKDFFCNYSSFYPPNKFAAFVCVSVKGSFHVDALFGFIMCACLLDIIIIICVFAMIKLSPPVEWLQARIAEIADLVSAEKKVS